MKKLTTKQIALNGILAGLYAAVTILTSSFAYGNIQFRLADSLCLLTALEPSLAVGISLGCLIANLFSTVTALDIFVGTAATLLGCLLTAKIRKTALVPLPTLLSNTLLVGAMLAFCYAPEAFRRGFILFGAEIALGQAVVLYALGVPLYLLAKKTALIEKLLAEKS